MVEPEMSAWYAEFAEALKGKPTGMSDKMSDKMQHMRMCPACAGWATIAEALKGSDARAREQAITRATRAEVRADRYGRLVGDLRDLVERYENPERDDHGH
jgi:hypothetical protein